MHTLHTMIYFIRAGENGPVKIGYSRNPQVRLANLQTGHYEPLQLVAIVKGDLGLETALHEHFKSLGRKLLNEWFALITDEEIGDAIKSVLDGSLKYERREDEEGGELLTKYEQARELIVDLLREFDEWLPAVELEDAIVSAGPCRRIVRQVRATLCREGTIQKRKVAEEWQWRIV